MKTLLVSLFFAFNAFGGADVESTTALQTQITNSISFPTFAKQHNINDKVSVQFRVDENFKINVVDVDSDSAMLVNHIKVELNGVTVNTNNIEVGKLYGVAISFTIL